MNTPSSPYEPDAVSHRREVGAPAAVDAPGAPDARTSSPTPAAPPFAHTQASTGQLALADVHHRLRQRLDETAKAWLTEALTAAHSATETARWERDFAAAARRCGRAGALPARVLLLHAASATPGTLHRLYGQGTAAERQAVLEALSYPPLDADEGALPLVEDALRANDSRLVAAAVGPYAARHLGGHAWRHAVLKCLFTGVPVDHVAALRHRAAGDAELARMLRDYARERTLAGRDVPEDLDHVLQLTADADPDDESGPETDPCEEP